MTSGLEARHMIPVNSWHRSMLDQLNTSLWDSDVWETAKIFMKHGQVTVGNRYLHFFDNEYCIKCQYTTLLITGIVKCILKIKLHMHQLTNVTFVIIISECFCCWFIYHDAHFVLSLCHKTLELEVRHMFPLDSWNTSMLDQLRHVSLRQQHLVDSKGLHGWWTSGIESWRRQLHWFSWCSTVNYLSLPSRAEKRVWALLARGNFVVWDILGGDECLSTVEAANVLGTSFSTMTGIRELE